MPVDRPDARELVETVEELLNDMLPRLSGYDSFQVRVAISLLAIAGREMKLGPGQRKEELERLSDFLGQTAPAEDLEEELIALIQEGDVEARLPDLMAHLKKTAEDRLRISNPKYLSAP